MTKREQIGHFLLLAPLGEGAANRVWLARDGRDGREVALKLLRDPADAAARARLRHEAGVLAGLDHINVLCMVDWGECGDAVWLATEYVAGPRAALTLALFRQLLLALEHVHGRGIVHADIKPANLLAGPAGILKLADFGIARRIGQGGSPAHGTLNYMPPEQLRGQAIDERADLFAAGIVLYQILAGKLPFEGSAFEVLQHKLHNTPILSGVAAFEGLLVRALAPNPAGRFDSARAFLNAFDEACQPHGISASHRENL